MISYVRIYTIVVILSVSLMHFPIAAWPDPFCPAYYRLQHSYKHPCSNALCGKGSGHVKLIIAAIHMALYHLMVFDDTTTKMKFHTVRVDLIEALHAHTIKYLIKNKFNIYSTQLNDINAKTTSPAKAYQNIYSFQLKQTHLIAITICDWICKNPP